MADWLSSMGVIAVMIVVLGVFALIQANKRREIRKQHPGIPRGYWMNHGIAVGMPIGMGAGVALGNVALGAALGMAIGTAIGAGLEEKHQDKTRPLTPEETRLRRQSILMGTGTLLAGLALFVILYLARR